MPVDTVVRHLQKPKRDQTLRERERKRERERERERNYVELAAKKPSDVFKASAIRHATVRVEPRDVAASIFVKEGFRICRGIGKMEIV